MEIKNPWLRYSPVSTFLLLLSPTVALFSRQVPPHYLLLSYHWWNPRTLSLVQLYFRLSLTQDSEPHSKSSDSFQNFKIIRIWPLNWKMWKDLVNHFFMFLAFTILYTILTLLPKSKGNTHWHEPFSHVTHSEKKLIPCNRKKKKIEISLWEYCEGQIGVTVCI